jgi:predicted permease
MLFIGVALMRLGWIDNAFIHTASTLVFNATMPTLLFLSVIKADLNAALQPALLVYYVAATLGGFLLAWGWAIWRCPVRDRGVYVQGPFAYWQIPLPDWLMTSGGYFAQLTLPLALICIGGTLSISVLRESSSIAMSSSLMKMVWFPALATLGAWLCGFRGAELGILFLYFGCPTAASSFVMARAVNSNHQLAATIIVITTLGAAVTINIGLFLLRWAGWI